MKNIYNYRRKIVDDLTINNGCISFILNYYNILYIGNVIITILIFDFFLKSKIKSTNTLHIMESTCTYPKTIFDTVMATERLIVQTSCQYFQTM